jgi:hypothetical protein
MTKILVTTITITTLIVPTIHYYKTIATLINHVVATLVISHQINLIIIVPIYCPNHKIATILTYYGVSLAIIVIRKSLAIIVFFCCCSLL